MAYNQLNCAVTLKNTGLACASEDLGYFQKWIWMKEDFEFATQSSAEDWDDWQTAINEKNIYPFKSVISVENATEEDVMEELPTGVSLFVREGKFRESGYVNMALCEMIAHRSFNGKKGRLAFATSNGYIVLYSPDTIKAKGFSYDNLRIGLQGPTDGSTQRKTKMYCSLSDPNEMGDYIVAIKPTWNPLDLEGVVDVDLALVGSTTASLVKFTVKRTCDNEAVLGLVAGDFDFLVTAGSAQTAVPGFAENGVGEYQYSASATIAAGTLKLKSPSLQTTGGYESDDTLAISVT